MPPVPSNFHFTSHSKSRSKDRAITKAQFVKTVTNPKTRKQQFKGQHGGFVYSFEREFGGKTLIVVAEVFKKDCYFITGYWSNE